MDFTVTYEPSPDEVSRAVRLGLRRQLRLFFWLAPAALVAAGLVFLLLRGDVGLGVGLFAGAVAFPLALTRIGGRAARKLTYLCVPTELHLTDDGYETRTEQSTSAIKWSLFGRVETGPEFWLFYVNGQLAGFLPRRAFTPDQQAGLDALLNGPRPAA